MRKRMQHFFLCIMHGRECIGHPFVVESRGSRVTGMRFYHPDKVEWNGQWGT